MIPRPALEIDQRRSAGRALAGRAPELCIRRAREEDTYALGRLAQLDSGLYDGGPALLAESSGELLAAVPLGGGGGRPFADPFRRTSEVVSLLELRAAQLEAVTPVRPSRLRRLLRAARRQRRYRAHA